MKFFSMSLAVLLFGFQLQAQYCDVNSTITDPDLLLNTDSKTLNDFYRNWSFVVGPVVYDKPKILKNYGPYEFHNKRMFGYNIGFDYHLKTSGMWSFSTGLVLALEPGYRFNTHLKKEDVLSAPKEDLSHLTYSYALSSFSVPILAHYTLRESDKASLGLLAGVKVMFFPPGNLEYASTVSNRPQSEKKKVFGLNLDSPDNSIQGSFILGARYGVRGKKTLWKLSLVRVINVQNILEGDYWTQDLIVTQLSAGKYKMSGNYWGLLCAITLKK